MNNILKNITTKTKIFKNITYNEIGKRLAIEKIGKFTNTGAYCVNTGKYTGRSPNDRYIVENKNLNINWGEVNKGISESKFDYLYDRVIDYYRDIESMYILDVHCGNSSQKHIKFITQYAWQYNFVKNMFIRPDSKLETEKLENQESDFTIINASGLKLERNIIDQLGLNSEAFIIMNIEKKIGIIGGTSYAGEMKKSIFSLMNYWLPNDDILTMHCSANVGKNKDTVLFFGLSGTGKTALSADPNRFLIGDDEHGWNNKGIFNLEGGCYAKTINLNRKSEPEIYDAIHENTILENVFLNENNETDYYNTNITENGRAAYPIHHIKNFSKELVLDHPKNIIFLTCDAFGILPPVSKLTNEEAMYHFLSGYTAKVAGTERGITEPTATFSACYGEPFLPLHPYRYAELLEKKISENNSNVYLVNTGWYKGGYGKGERMNIELTRSCINSILDNSILNSKFEKLPIFNLSIPNELEYIPNSILNPINTWDSKQEYYKESEKLAQMFISNFDRYNDNINMKNLIKYGPII